MGYVKEQQHIHLSSKYPIDRESVFGACPPLINQMVDGKPQHREASAPRMRGYGEEKVRQRLPRPQNHHKG